MAVIVRENRSVATQKRGTWGSSLSSLESEVGFSETRDLASPAP
jgi:hypothetical protein